MKKIILAVSLVASVFAANAQEKGAFRVGLRGAVNTQSALNDDIERTLGPGAGLSIQYAFTDNITAEVGGNYFFKSEQELLGFKFSTQTTEINVNIKYYVTSETLDFLPENVQLYAFGGLNRTMNKLEDEVNGSSDDNITGFNAGAGVDYLLSDNFGITLQGKYAGVDYGGTGESAIVGNLGAFLSF